METQTKFVVFCVFKTLPEENREFLEIWLSLLAPSEPVGCSYVISHSLFLSLSHKHTHVILQEKIIHVKCYNPSVLLYSHEQFGF